MAKYIKNIEHETVLNLGQQVEVIPGKVVSRTLAQNKSVSLTLFAFDKGEEISVHDSKGDAFVHVLDGEGTFTVDGKVHVLKAGEALVMPAGKPHAVFASQAFKMMLTVIFPKED
jgi:quercetin dioxygenase-like cupin family protein